MANIAKPMVLYQKSAYGYYREPHQATQRTHLNPIRPPLPPNLGLTIPSQNLHHKLQLNGARYNGSLFWQPMGNIPSPYPIVPLLTLRGTLAAKRG